MKSPYTKIFCAFIVSAFFFAGCKIYDKDSNVVLQPPDVSDQNANITNIGAKQNPAKDDAEELAKIIKIPYETEEALWKIEPGATIPNSNHGETAPKLIAVLKFKSEDAQKIVEQAEKSKPATDRALNVENWFPPELIAKSQESGDETVNGNVYSAAEFAQTPYQNGSLTRITGTDYFVLELSAR